MKATIEWFKIYKIPDGKPENQFAFNGEAKSKDFALHVIEEVHQHWKNLVKREAPAGGIAWFVLNIISRDNNLLQLKNLFMRFVVSSGICKNVQKF